MIQSVCCVPLPHYDPLFATIPLLNLWLLAFSVLANEPESGKNIDQTHYSFASNNDSINIVWRPQTHNLIAWTHLHLYFGRIMGRLLIGYIDVSDILQKNGSIFDHLWLLLRRTLVFTTWLLFLRLLEFYTRIYFRKRPRHTQALTSAEVKTHKMIAFLFLFDDETQKQLWDDGAEKESERLNILV